MANEGIRFVGATGEPFTHDVPEVTLWINVIARAVLDLDAGGRGGETIRLRASRWVFGPDHDGDFALACQHAGLSPTWVRRLAKEAPARFARLLAEAAERKRQGKPRVRRNKQIFEEVSP